MQMLLHRGLLLYLSVSWRIFAVKCRDLLNFL
jgi:hypothetical protein